MRSHAGLQAISLALYNSLALKAMNPKSDIFQGIESSFMRFQRSIRRHESSWQKKSQLSLLETMILRFIVLEGPQKMKDVSSKFEIKLSTLTSVIDKFERSNLLIRKQTEHDRRVVLLHASKKGKKLFESYRTLLAQMFGQLKSHLPDKQFSHFVEAVFALHFAISDALPKSDTE